MLTEKSTNHWSVSPDESGEEYFLTLCNTEQFFYYTNAGWRSSRMDLRMFDTFDHACQFAAKLADELPGHHCISIYSDKNQKMITMYGQR